MVREGYRCGSIIGRILLGGNAVDYGVREKLFDSVAELMLFSLTAANTSYRGAISFGFTGRFEPATIPPRFFFPITMPSFVYCRSFVYHRRHCLVCPLRGRKDGLRANEAQCG